MAEVSFSERVRDCGWWTYKLFSRNWSCQEYGRKNFGAASAEVYQKKSAHIWWVLAKSKKNGEKIVLMHYTPTFHPSTFLNKHHVDELVSAEDKESMSRLHYASVIGHLQYLNTCTQPDLAYVLSKLSTYLKNPRLMHWQTAVGCCSILRQLSWLAYVTQVA